MSKSKEGLQDPGASAVGVGSEQTTKTATGVIEAEKESRIAQQEAKRGLSRSQKLNAVARIVGIVEGFSVEDQEWILQSAQKLVKEQ